MRRAGWIGLVLGVAVAARAEPPPRQRFEENMMVRMHMTENFGLVHELERNLIAGKLDAARDLARALAQAPDEPGAKAWAREAARVRERAGAIAAAKTVDEAIRADAQLAAACADCHVAAGAQPEFARWPALPPDGATVEARMARHLWAAERVWEGVVGDAPESWRAGLDVLASAPLPATTLGAAREPYAKKLQRLARDARDRKPAVALADRATAYGELLATCAACHAAKP